MAKKEEKVDNEVVVSEEKKKTSAFGIVKKIISIVFWIVILVWIGICVFDYYNTYKEKDPRFCLSKETLTYDDGTVEVCHGPGYKVYNYDRSSIKGYQYGPFWMKERTSAK